MHAGGVIRTRAAHRTASFQLLAHQLVLAGHTHIRRTGHVFLQGGMGHLRVDSGKAGLELTFRETVVVGAADRPRHMRGTERYLGCAFLQSHGSWVVHADDHLRLLGVQQRSGLGRQLGLVGPLVVGVTLRGCGDLAVRSGRAGGSRGHGRRGWVEQVGRCVAGLHRGGELVRRSGRGGQGHLGYVLVIVLGDSLKAPVLAELEGLEGL